MALFLEYDRHSCLSISAQQHPQPASHPSTRPSRLTPFSVFWNLVPRGLQQRKLLERSAETLLRFFSSRLCRLLNETGKSAPAPLYPGAIAAEVCLICSRSTYQLPPPLHHRGHVYLFAFKLDLRHGFRAVLAGLFAHAGDKNQYFDSNIG